MIDVATLSVIRRWALREQMSIREISRRTGLARNTVKKYLRAGDEEPRYARRVSSSKLDPYADKLSTWLSIEATKSRKQRRTLLQLHTPVGWPRLLHLEQTLGATPDAAGMPTRRRESWGQFTQTALTLKPCVDLVRL